MGAPARTVKLTVVAAVAFGLLAGLAVALETNTGSRKAERLKGTPQADLLKGLAGNDVLIGGDGADVLIGGKGNDKLRGGPMRDGFNMRDGVELSAPGNDKIFARDGGNDEINCGAGNDVAIVDASEDGVIGCEVVREP
jgi:RTX calcium-binding nonapeptide repeat (4 copies)